MPPEANLIDVAHEATPYEDVVCVGLFQSAGRGIPRESLVAVTEKKVHVFAVRSVEPEISVSNLRLFVSLDRSTTEARMAETVLVLTDAESGREYRFDSSTGQGLYVIRELVAA